METGNYVSAEEFQKQFFAVEGINVSLIVPEGTRVPPYDYTQRLGNNRTVKELYRQLSETLRPVFEVSCSSFKVVITNARGEWIRNMDMELCVLRRMRKMTAT